MENVNIAMGGVGFSDWLGLFAFCGGVILGCIGTNLIAYVCWEMGKPSVYHVPKFSKYLQLFFVYSLTELRIKFGLRSEKAQLLFEQAFLDAIGQPHRNERAKNGSDEPSEEDFHRPNEKEISHGRVSWQTR